MLKEGDKVKLETSFNGGVFMDDDGNYLPALKMGEVGTIVEVIYEDGFDIEGIDNEYAVEFDDKVYGILYGYEISPA
jgi:hypothetical protein